MKDRCLWNGKTAEWKENMVQKKHENGVHGVYSCSQVCAGHLNGLVVRIFGSEGSIEWVQEEPDYLKVTKKGQPDQIYYRGTGYITGMAAERNHIPSGHL